MRFLSEYLIWKVVRLDFWQVKERQNAQDVVKLWWAMLGICKHLCPVLYVLCAVYCEKRILKLERKVLLQHLKTCEFFILLKASSLVRSINHVSRMTDCYQQKVASNFFFLPFNHSVIHVYVFQWEPLSMSKTSENRSSKQCMYTKRNKASCLPITTHAHNCCELVIQFPVLRLTYPSVLSYYWNPKLSRLFLQNILDI